MGGIARCGSTSPCPGPSSAACAWRRARATRSGWTPDGSLPRRTRGRSSSTRSTGCWRNRSPMETALFAVAGRCALRQAHFLAAIQVIVYAGAVVVLFVFVIMLINVPEDKLPVERVTGMRFLGVVVAGMLILQAALVVRRPGVAGTPAAASGARARRGT